jgi:hypothetical protein
MTNRAPASLPAEAELPFAILASFFFFLARRPVSGSNGHYLSTRLRGLKSLTPVLEQTNLPENARRVLRDLEVTTPVSFQRKSRALQLGMLTVSRGEIDYPSDYVVTGQSPSWSRGELGAVHLVLGASIGIGDEITLFPLVRWLKELGAERVVLFTAYAKLWDSVVGVDEVRVYSEHRELLEVLRSSADLIVLADFEKPGLSPIMAREPSVKRYLEIALGAENAVVVDRPARCAHSFRMPTEKLINYYHGLDEIARWLHFRVAPEERFTNLRHVGASKATDALTIFFSPFTSKFDPSSIFWARLLVQVLAQVGTQPVRLRVDAGANLSTQAFAEVMRQSLTARCGGNVQVEVARGEGRQTLPLDALWRELEQANVVICTDSFVAHAAPLCGCCTLVLAGSELTNWRVPSPSSFYFDGASPVDELAAALARVVETFRPAGEPVKPPRALLQAGKRLLDSTARLRGALGEGELPLLEQYRRFVEDYELSVDGLSGWPREFGELLSDVDYSAGWRSSREGDAELLRYLQNRLDTWQNSNLYKFLRLS